MNGVTIRGHLAGNAEARSTASHPVKAHIYCDIITGPGDAPVHVRYRVPGRGYSAEISAKCKADDLRKGAPVYARGAGLAPAFGGLMLRDVEALELAGESRARRVMDKVAP